MSPLKPLIAKLNPACHRALEAAAQMCLTRTHYAVEVQHLLIRLIEIGEGDVGRLLRHYGVDGAALTGVITSRARVSRPSSVPASA